MTVERHYTGELYETVCAGEEQRAGCGDSDISPTIVCGGGTGGHYKAKRSENCIRPIDE